MRFFLSALRRTDRARHEPAMAATALSVELSQASLRLEAARGQLALLRSEDITWCPNTYESSIRGAEFNTFNFVDMIEAQSMLNQAQSQYSRALAESRRAAANIDRGLGMCRRLARTFIQTVQSRN